MARRDPFDRPLAGARSVGDEAAIYRDRARRLGLSFVPGVQLGKSAHADLAAIRRGTFAMSPQGEGIAYLAPDEDALPAIRHWLGLYPGARPRLRVSTPSAIRAALIGSAAARLATRAVGRLCSRYPDLSARFVATRGQLAIAFALAAAIAVAFALAPMATFVAINLTSAVFFFGVSALRFIAAGYARRRQHLEPVLISLPDADLPIYSVLVPLYDEAPLVPDLVAALGAIDWPRDRLDVKLILEAGDAATIAAARRVAGQSCDIVIVPPAGPRTKPKALAFALQFARGQLVTVYDAEDRPHPRQLREAHAAFAAAGPDLACLQSPLVVDNGGASLLSLLFAVEYAALFDGLLPALAHLGMPLPLGGTSNHFRREALDDVGGWDPYNVTEDADLGLRLARFGYRSATLSLPTLEEAPAALGPWLGQRTRWFKGWMQTWLVHTRRPFRLARELGPTGFLGFNLIGTGLIVSSMVYPIYLATILAVLTDPLDLWGDGGMFAAMVLGVDLFNLVAGYLAMAVLAGRALDLRGHAGAARALVLLPVYWFLMSVASYRAVFQLVARPHHWEKTPHRGRGSRQGLALINTARAPSRGSGRVHAPEQDRRAPAPRA